MADPGPDGAPSEAETRLKGFVKHLVVYFVVMAVLVAVNVLTSTAPWFLLPLIGWGAVLAIHAAHAIGLFSTFKRNNDGEK